MAIIYMCPTGTHSSLVAANLHIGKIDLTSSVSDILHLPYYGQVNNKPGFFLFIGKDNQERAVYTLGVYHEAEIIKRSALDLLKLFNKERDFFFVDVSKFMPKVSVWCNAFLKKEMYPRENIAVTLKENLKEIYYEVKKYNNYI